MRLYPLAWLAALLPLATINLTFLLSASHGQVDWCIPYLHSCTSISATGREPPAYFVFKGLMIPAAVLLMLYWLLCTAWLRTLGCHHKHWRTLVVCLGLLGSSGLAFYSLMLGWIGEVYRFHRQTGVTAFFGFSFFAQLVVAWLLERCAGVRQNFARQLGWLRINAGLIWLLGLASILMGYISPDLYKRTDDAIAWNFTLLLCCHLLITGDLWRRTGWRLVFDLDRSSI